MPYNVLLLPLLGGYMFVLNFNPLSYWARNQSSYHVLFASAVAGAFSLGFATGLAWLYLGQTPKKDWGYLFEIPWLLPSTIAFVLGFSSFLLNLFPVFSKRKAALRAAQKKNDNLALLLTRALVKRIPVAISLKSGKVYIGYITREPETFTHEMKYTQILPVLSGYRETNTKELKITTNYAATLKKLDFKPQNPYDIIIPIEEIETVRFHDNYLFQGFNPKS